MTLPATTKGSWISKELKQVYGARRFKAGKGVDLNGNGRLEKREKISTYNRNKIPGNDRKVIGDWTDWLAFYRTNYRTIHAKTRRSKNSIFFWAGKLKTTNPLHVITSIESPVVKQADVLTTYKKTWAIIARARKVPIKGSTKLKRAKANLLAVRSAIIASGTKITEYFGPSNIFVKDMVLGTLDCDTASFVLLTEAHEKGWPLYGVRASRHFFVRWDNPRTRVKFNMDANKTERFPKDSKYKHISPHAISGGVYLSNLSLSALVSSAITNRALAYKDAGKNKEALRDYTEAIRLDSKNIMAYLNRGALYGILGGSHNLLNAKKDFTKIVKLNPKDAYVIRNIGLVYTRLAKHTEAVKEFTKAIKVNPKFVGAYVSRGVAYILQAKYPKAQTDFLTAKRLNRSPVQRQKLSDFIFKTGKAAFREQDYTAAFNLFKILRAVNPKHFTVNALIKRCMQLALRHSLLVAVRKKYGASKTESYVKTILRTQKWSTLKQLGITADIQKAFGQLGHKKAASNPSHARKLVKKILANWK